jgi:PAS domain S-box-containing protein
VQFEARHRCKDGTLIDVEVSVQYIAALGEQFFAFVRNITERKRAEIALRENIALLEGVINSSADYIFVKDRDLRTILCNKVFAQALGKAPEELYGKTDIENGWSADLVLGCPDQGIRGFQQDDLAALSGQTVHSRADLGNVGSDIRVFDSLKVPLRSDGGEIIGMLGISRDVTELRRAEERVAELTRNFVAFLENTTDFIYFKDQDSRFRFCSQTLAVITGHASWRDMIGKHDLEVFPPDTAQIYHEEELPIFRDGVPLLHRIDPYYDAAGNTGWVSTNKWPLLDGDGKVVGLFGISRDVTERKQAEEKLAESESHLRTIIESEPECIKIVDAQGRLTQMNPAGLAMIEADSLEQVAGQSVLDVIAPEYRKAFAAMHQRVLAGETVQMEFEVLGLRGGRRWLETRAVPMQEHGQTVQLAVTRDITARKVAEAEILRSNAELEQFSYAISHDMRQPLRMISSYMQLLEKGLAGQLDAEKLEFFNFAIDGAKRLDAMLVGLLDYSRVGRKGEPPEMVGSRDMLDQALLFLGPAMVEAQAVVHIEGDWPRVYVRLNEILRLLQNLIGNALKYRVEGRQPQITVTSEVLPEEWRVCISDNGVGIVPGQIDRLFQVFQRLQSRADYEGTGIGLALCRKIIEHHGGKIWAESAGEGQGSRFTFSIPDGPSLPEAK